MKWAYRFFVVLGVIFFFILIGIGYFVITDPFNLRPIIMSMYTSSADVQTPDTSTARVEEQISESSADNHSTSVMTATQEAALKSVGIDPTVVPTQFTPEQITCFIGVLGEKRVAEIKAGDTPTPAEFYQAKNCV